MGYESGSDYDRLVALREAIALRRRIGGAALPAQDPPQRPTSADAMLLAESVGLIEDPSYLVVAFYDALFGAGPGLRALFPASMGQQQDRLLRALLALVDGAANTEALIPFLEQLGRDHRKFGIRPGHYRAVRDALLTALRSVIGPRWRPEYAAAWERIYAFAAGLMIAAADAAVGDPPYWYATIVAHERPTANIAILRLRTQAPYRYAAGQYAQVESPTLPRVWRPYSIACAPGGDGVLELHIRKVGGGGLSDALVTSAGIGDKVRLGPPMGSMTLDACAGRDVLLVAGGTGLAPMKAIAQQWATDPTGRRLNMYLGVRTTNELYDRAALHALATVPGITTVVAVSEDPTYAGPQGTIGDVVGADRGASWRDHEVYIGGPPAMVSATRARLEQVPAGQIHHDPFG